MFLYCCSIDCALMNLNLNFLFVCLMLIFVSCCGPGTLIDGRPIINLPPKTITLTKVDFSKEEWAFYKKLESDSLKKFKVLSILHHYSS